MTGPWYPARKNYLRRLCVTFYLARAPLFFSTVHADGAIIAPYHIRAHVRFTRYISNDNDDTNVCRQPVRAEKIDRIERGAKLKDSQRIAAIRARRMVVRRVSA